MAAFYNFLLTPGAVEVEKGSCRLLVSLPACASTGQQVEAAGAVGSRGNVCLLTTASMGGSGDPGGTRAITCHHYLSRCACCVGLLTPSLCSAAVRDGLARCGRTPATCV